jgi:RNAse (barnase) inhibitor barstar
MIKFKNISADYYTENNVRYVFIDGNTCDTIGKCYTTLQQQLSIPDYFGFNLDALEEVLADLEWVNEEKITIIIINKPALLQNDEPMKDAFLDILQKNDNDKVQIVYLGEEY